VGNLRERLAPIFACGCDPAWTERKLHDPRCIEELLDDVLERTQAWLRDKAAVEVWVNLDNPACATLMALADEIDPPKGDIDDSPCET
jgi:hypothetical protein